MQFVRLSFPKCATVRNIMLIPMCNRKAVGFAGRIESGRVYKEPDYESEGRTFESFRARQKPPPSSMTWRGFCVFGGGAFRVCDFDQAPRDQGKATEWSSVVDSAREIGDLRARINTPPAKPIAASRAQNIAGVISL